MIYVGYENPKEIKIMANNYDFTETLLLLKTYQDSINTRKATAPNNPVFKYKEAGDYSTPFKYEGTCSITDNTSRGQKFLNLLPFIDSYESKITCEGTKTYEGETTHKKFTDFVKEPLPEESITYKYEDNSNTIKPKESCPSYSLGNDKIGMSGEGTCTEPTEIMEESVNTLNRLLDGK